MDSKQVVAVEQIAAAMDYISKSVAGENMDDTLTRAFGLGCEKIADAIRDGLGEIAAAIISRSEQ